MSAEPDVDPRRGPAADGQPSAARQVSELLADAARAGWHDRGRILVVALVVSLATAGAEITADHIFDPSNNALSIVGTLSVEMISLFGTILLSGFLCRLVAQDRYEEVESSRPTLDADQSGVDQSDADQRAGSRVGTHQPTANERTAVRAAADRPDGDRSGADQRGEDRPGQNQAAAEPLGEDQSTPDHAAAEDQRTDRVGTGQPVEGPVTVGHVLRDLPWVRLAIADILAAILVGVGLLLLVIPGLVVLNLLGVLGPVIEIERRSVFAALRRSARLVRQHFWWVALLITVPVVAVGELESVLPDPHGLAEILEVLAARGLGQALVETAIGLIVVEVCFWLIDQDARRPPPGD